jgi:RNA polymerase sigma factor (sigma-70 family)
LNSAVFIEKLRGGSAPEFDRLARDLFHPLLHFLVNDKRIQKEDAEELVLDALVKVHSGVGRFRPDGGAMLSTWIFLIAENCAIDFLRTHREEFVEFQESDAPIRWNGQFAGRNTAWLAWLRVELAKLKAVDRRILFWRADDISYAEIGGWLGIKENTARTRHCRAMKKIKNAENQPEPRGITTEPEIEGSGAGDE